LPGPRRRPHRRRRPCASHERPCRHREVAHRAPASRRPERAGPAPARLGARSVKPCPTTGTRASRASAGAICIESSTAAHPRRSTGAGSGTSEAARSEAMIEGAALLVGRHDFTTFRSAHCQSESPVKTLDRLEVSREGDEIRIEAAARSFLHHQVRSMVGCLAMVGRGQWAPEDIETALMPATALRSASTRGGLPRSRQSAERPPVLYSLRAEPRRSTASPRQ
jgi:tRNA U38,U39,U40 pseudouridine synthase TruA